MIVKRRIRDAAHHPVQSKIVHREKGAVKEDEGEGEMNLAPRFVHHAAKHFGKPEINRTEHSEEAPAKQHIMDVRDDEVGVVNEEVDRSGGHVNSAETADNKHRDKRQSETHGGGVANGSAPDRTHPVKRFDG